MAADQRVCFILQVRQGCLEEYGLGGAAPDAAMRPLAETFHLD